MQILIYIAIFAVGVLMGAYFALKWCEFELDKELEDEWEEFMESAKKQREDRDARRASEHEQKTYTADKCHFPDGVDVRPDGMHKLDPCIYTRRETHENVTVHIDQCLSCGHIQISWDAQANSKHRIYSQLSTPAEDNWVIKRYLKKDEQEAQPNPEVEEDEDNWND